MAEVAKQGGLVESGFSPGVIGNKAALVGGASDFSFESGRYALGIFMALAPAATGLGGIAPELLLNESAAVVRACNVVHYSVKLRSPGREALSAIVRMLDEEPIESGVTHAAEPRLVEYLRNFGDSDVMALVRELGASSRAASLIGLLGRSEALSAELRRQLLSWGLASSSVEVRDAAIQAAENWNDAALAGLLRAHREPVAWLSDYATAIANELEG